MSHGAGDRLNFLVTGCAGFIGSHLVERICELGHKVTGVDCFMPLLYSKAEKVRNLDEIAQSPNFEFIELDLRTGLPTKLLEGIDVIINLAAMPGLTPSWTSMQDYFDCNSLVVGNICSASKKLGGVPILHASTSSVYGLSALTDESGPLKPISPYGVSKLAAEQLLMAFLENFGTPFTILRYFSVFGPRQRPDMAYRRIVENILNGRPIEIYGNGTQSRSNTYVSDIVEATITSSQLDFTGEIFNIGGSESITLLNAVKTIETISGIKANLEYMPRKFGDQQETIADSRKAQKTFDFHPRTKFIAGITEQIAWQRSHPILI